MAVTPRNGLGALPVLGCIIALVLLSFTAIRLMGSSLEARSYALSQATVGTAAATPAAKPKGRARYQATIENWRHYRSASPAEAP